MFRTRYLMLLAAVLIVPAIACSSGKKDTTEDATPGATNATPAATRSAGGTPAAGGNELASVLAAYNSVKSFRAMMVTELPGQPRQEGIIEAQLPDRVHVALGSLEFISIGADSYVKVGASWTKAPTGFGNVFSLNQLATSMQAYTTNAAITKGSTDTVAGKSCQIYNYSASGVTSELCVADNKPLRVVTDVGGRKVTIVFTDFDSVEVKAPI